jgi:hypothetical protein
MVGDFAWSPIDEICGSKKSFIPKLKRHGNTSQERKTNLNNMFMFFLSGSILLMSMRTRNLVHGANFGEERI